MTPNIVMVGRTVMSIYDAQYSQGRKNIYVNI